MESIKQTIKTPKNHEICLKIPDHVQEDELVEIIMNFPEKSNEYNRKINELKTAVMDEQFLQDLKQVEEDFKDVDLEEW